MPSLRGIRLARHGGLPVIDTLLGLSKPAVRGFHVSLAHPLTHIMPCIMEEHETKKGFDVVCNYCWARKVLMLKTRRSLFQHSNLVSGSNRCLPASAEVKGFPTLCSVQTMCVVVFPSYACMYHMFVLKEISVNNARSLQYFV